MSVAMLAYWSVMLWDAPPWPPGSSIILNIWDPNLNFHLPLLNGVGASQTLKSNQKNKMLEIEGLWRCFYGLKCSFFLFRTWLGSILVFGGVWCT